MFKIGTISFLVSQTDSGNNEWGVPELPTDIYSDFYQCNIQGKEKLIKYENGMYRDASYIIIIDSDKVSDLDLTNCHTVKLKDSNDNELAVKIWQVINIEFRKLTKKIEVIV